MTSDSAPSPYACTVSSWYNQSGGESFPVWKAFDKEGMNPSSANASNRGWCTTSADAQTQSSWLRYTLGANRRLTKYELYGGNAQAGNFDHYRGPSAWLVQGSANQSDWVTLATVSNAPKTALKQTFIMPETTSTYWYYRLQFTGINDGFVEIAELVLYAA